MVLDRMWGMVCVPIEKLVRSSTLRSRTRSLPVEDRYRSRPELDVYSTLEPLNDGGAEPWSFRVSCWEYRPFGKALEAESVPEAPAMLLTRCPDEGLDVS
jgi:hypothetical protein